MSEQIRRYSVEPWDIRRADMKPDEDGDYVRYDDHLNLLTAMIADRDEWKLKAENYGTLANINNRCLDIERSMLLTMTAERDALVEALEGVSQRLAFNEFGECRGWSEGLLGTKHALDNSRKALIAAKKGVTNA